MSSLPNHFYLAIMSLFFSWSNPTLASDTAIVIHGGAGTILKEKMSESVEKKHNGLKRILRKELYEHEKVNAMTSKAKEKGISVIKSSHRQYENPLHSGNKIIGTYFSNTMALHEAIDLSLIHI